jgi:hypothetical protein
LEDRNLWAYLHTRKRKKPDENNDENTEMNEKNEQKLPGFIANSAGMVYICLAEGCAKVFSNYHNYAAHIELDIHDNKISQETLLVLHQKLGGIEGSRSLLESVLITASSISN